MQLKGGGTPRGEQAHYVVDGGTRRIILQVLVTPGVAPEDHPLLDLVCALASAGGCLCAR
jgi:hypothetical protein